MGVSGWGRLGGAGGDREKVIYSGRRVVVVDEEPYGLVAYPREIPRQGEKEYLLYMIDELSVVVDELFGRTGRTKMYIYAGVKYGGEWHGVVMERVGGVRFAPLVDDYVAFIRTADLVSLRAIDESVGRLLMVYSGRYTVVIEDERGILFAFARPIVELGADSLMLAIIREVMGRIKELTAGRSGEGVVIRGSVMRGDAVYIPIVYDNLAVVFVWTGDDYEYFVRAAERVVFPRLFGQRR